jgi:hypothetical protein
MEVRSIADELKARQIYMRMIRQLRAGGLKHDRRGTLGESLDEFPMTEKGFSLAIAGERDYRMTLGLRTETVSRTVCQWLFCKLEHLAAKGEHPWVELQCQVSTDRWRAVSDQRALDFKMKHPFALYVFSVDHLAISPTRFGATILEGSVEAAVGNAAKLFERGKL